MHFVGASHDGPRVLTQFVEKSGMRVYDLCQPPELREGVRLSAEGRRDRVPEPVTWACLSKESRGH